MKIKIITLILLIILVLIGNAEAFTLTQKLGSEYIETTVEKDEEIRMIFTSKDGFRFKNWVLVEGNISINLSSNDITFSMPNEDVTIEAEYDTTYVITFNSNDGTGATTSMTVAAGATTNLTANPFTRDGYVFKYWSATSNGAKAYDDGAEVTPEGNMELYAIWEIEEIISVADVPIGAYIQYIPNPDPITVLGTQTFTPSEYEDGWKVFKKINGQLQIISAESVGELWLGGKTNYTDAVDILNGICSQYVGEFAVKGRSLGSTDEWITGLVNKENIDSTKSIGTIDTGESTGYPLTYSDTYSLTNKYPYMDTHYTNDQTIINTQVNGTYPLRHSNKYSDGKVWLASRYLYIVSGERSNFSVRTLNSSGNTYDYDYVYYAKTYGNPYTDAFGNGIRPVITLESGLKIVDGEGTQAKPFILSR